MACVKLPAGVFGPPYPTAPRSSMPWTTVQFVEDDHAPPQPFASAKAATHELSATVVTEPVAEVELPVAVAEASGCADCLAPVNEIALIPQRRDEPSETTMLFAPVAGATRIQRRNPSEPSATFEPTSVIATELYVTPVTALAS